jgi:DNA polymerase-1
MQVHDELVVDAPESEVEQVCAIMKYGMENIYTISIPLVAEPKVGNKYSEIK